MCFINNTSRIASVWFGDKQRGLSTALGSLSLSLGAIAGFIIPSLIINEHDELEVSVGKTKFIEYMVV